MNEYRYLVVFDRDNNCIAYKKLDSIMDLPTAKIELKNAVSWGQLYALGI